MGAGRLSRLVMITVPVTLLVVAKTNPDRGVGVDALSEVGMMGEVHDVETGIVGDASMPEQLAHLVDTGLQSEAEENIVVGGHTAVVPSRLTMPSPA